MIRLALGFLVGFAAPLLVHVERGSGSWSARMNDSETDSFHVDTVEVFVGRFYVETVWGWWA